MYVPYNELEDTFQGYINPKPSILAERLKFRARVQKDEPLHELVAELQKSVNQP